MAIATHTRGDIAAITSPGDVNLHATLQSIDAFTNRDVEMQGPLSEESTIVVLDTNILLEFLDVIQTFVDEIEAQNLPVFIIIPGAVIYELDGQKNRDGLAWFARRASTWLLKKVKERKSVKGQTLNETCKPSGNWKKREPGTEFGTERTNDALILDCCAHFLRFRRLRTFLCSKDKILGVEAESAGVPCIFPEQGSFCSREIAQNLFGNEVSLSGFSPYHPTYRNSSMELVQDMRAIGVDDDGMDVDDEFVAPQPVYPSHALDLLHLQVIDHFTRLLLELVGRVGGTEIQRFGMETSNSRHAPQYSRRIYFLWTAPDCLEYLDTKKTVPQNNPRVDIFTAKPYERPGARRGQDWSRRDWEVCLRSLAAIGDMWEEGSIQESVPAVEFHMMKVFAMPLRPTGL
ncbi:PIN domain-containing protein [Hygrophoropsis aurantiaca]|uniref:PIN domain-containing protein n=1 Tax=Hygrophoropsis aurantiaca TaxID=72124 RepID=A0ACB8AMI1_9AGAM|nr:PIN domain-containing protein [Hygrophoropsis aurantiaca]